MPSPETRIETCALCGLDPNVPTIRRPTRMVALDPSMQALLRRVARFARRDAPVLILGESGTGKELVARALHANGPRADGPFVAVNVAALPAALLESELFGHARGAFTGAERDALGLFRAADGGTLFLDEIAELPLELQPKLLRALQDGEVRPVGDPRPVAVDVRIVSATHRALSAAVEAGRFREDLHYRLEVLTLRVPPLRERPGDLIALAWQRLAEEAEPELRFAPEVEAALRAYDWPGNVRELRSVVEHGAALADGAVIRLDDLPDKLRTGARAPTAPRPDLASPVPAPALDRAAIRPLAEVERACVEAALVACEGSVVEAARALGISRSTLWRKLKGWSAADGAAREADRPQPGKSR